MIYDREFYTRNARDIARTLIGARLVRELDGERLSGTIVETEAYTGLDDLASHGRVGKTERNMPMWEEPGHAYLYLIYGMYWLLNIAVEPAGQPAAVLIRGIEPVEGLATMQRLRGPRRERYLTSGPGRLTIALSLTGDMNRADMTTADSGLWIEHDQAFEDTEVESGPRIGLGKNVPEPWLSMPWRWWLRGNMFVSK
jgi:DNA-3-methyladenine glycosylase